MKKFIVISILLGFGLMITLNSCKKKEEETTPATLTSTATIKGKVWAILDATNATEEYAPSGTKIIVTITTQDLVDYTLDAEKIKTLSYETTLDGSGNYSISIPATSKIFTAKVNGVDFEYEQTVWDYTTTPTSTKKERKVYTVGQSIVNIQAGTVQINDLGYN